MGNSWAIGELKIYILNLYFHVRNIENWKKYNQIKV